VSIDVVERPRQLALVEPERDLLVLGRSQELIEGVLVPVDGDPCMRDAVAGSLLNPIEVEQQGGGRLRACRCRCEFGAGNDSADRSELGVVPDELCPRE